MGPHHIAKADRGDDDYDDYFDNDDDFNKKWTTLGFSKALDTCDVFDTPLSSNEGFTVMYRYSNDTSLSSLHTLSRSGASSARVKLFPSLSSPFNAPTSPSSPPNDTSSSSSSMNDIRGIGGHVHQGRHVSPRSGTSGGIAPPPMFGDKNVTSVSLTFSNMTLTPDNDTMYYCQGLAIPFDNRVHVIQIDPVIPPLKTQGSKDAEVHHIVLWLCEEPLSQEDLNHKGMCIDPKSTPLGLTKCRSTPFLAVWAMGGGSFVLPRQAGYPVNENGTKGNQYFVMELHIDNKDRQSSLSGPAGFKLWYTPSLRRYDAGVFGTGYELYNLTIPPGEKAIAFESTCPASCIADLPSDGVKVFGSLLHAHTLGKSIWVKRIREGKEIRELDRNDNFDNHNQIFKFHRPPIIIKNGDAFITRCVYDTSGRNESVRGGLATNNEMCGSFMSYYPRVKGLRFCGSMPSNYRDAMLTKHDTASLPLAIDYDQQSTVGNASSSQSANSTSGSTNTTMGTKSVVKWGLPTMYPQISFCQKKNDIIRFNMTDILDPLNFNITQSGLTVVTIDKPLSFTPRVRRVRPIRPSRPLMPLIRRGYPFPPVQQCIRPSISRSSVRSGSGTRTSPSQSSLSPQDFDFVQWLDAVGNVKLLWRCDYYIGMNGQIVPASRPQVPPPIPSPSPSPNATSSNSTGGPNSGVSRPVRLVDDSEGGTSVYGGDSKHIQDIINGYYEGNDDIDGVNEIDEHVLLRQIGIDGTQEMYQGINDHHDRDDDDKDEWDEKYDDNDDYDDDDDIPRRYQTTPPQPPGGTPPSTPSSGQPPSPPSASSPPSSPRGGGGSGGGGLNRLRDQLMRPRPPVSVRAFPLQCAIASFAIQVKTKGIIELGFPSANGTDWVVGGVNGTSVTLNDQYQRTGSYQLMDDDNQDLFDIEGWPYARYIIRSTTNGSITTPSGPGTRIYIPPTIIDVDHATVKQLANITSSSSSLLHPPITIGMTWNDFPSALLSIIAIVGVFILHE